MSNLSVIHTAVIGCGVISGVHIHAYQKNPSARVLALCDLQLDRAKQKAAEFGIERIESDAAKIFADPNIHAVSICTDHASHSELAIAALRAGKHVLCEKPLSSSVPKMRAMIDEGKRHPELVFAGIFQHRFDPIYRCVKALIERGGFGRILNANLSMQCLRTREYYDADAWRGTWAQEGGSVLMNQAIHTIDILQWLMGGVSELSGFFDNLAHQGIIETEDCAVAALRFKNAALGTIVATSASHLYWEPAIRIYGTEASLELCNEKVLRFTASDPAVTEKVLLELQQQSEVQKDTASKDYYGFAHPAQINDFIDAIKENRPPFVTAEVAFDAVELAQKILGRA